MNFTRYEAVLRQYGGALIAYEIEPTERNALRIKMWEDELRKMASILAKE